jgi:hypothetical protein
VCVLLTACVVALGGCQLFPRTSTVSSKDDWSHSNLYNHRAPHSRLLVEIDAVEGQRATKDELRALEEFLRRNCDKPGGITLRVDSIIPRQTALGRTAESLAAEFMCGHTTPDTAYLYIIFYHARLRGKDVATENPSFSHLPHPVVYIDRSYRMLGNPYPATFARAVLLHEAGHAVGLCATTNHHGREGHCINVNCRMNSAINFNPYRFLTLRNPWTNTALCADCIAELERNKSNPSHATVEFWHGYFRRTEPGYEILGVPGLYYVRFGAPLTTPSDELREARRQAIAGLATGEYSFWATAEAFDPWEHREAFGRFVREKEPPLRLLARDVFKKIFEHLDDLAVTESDAVRESLTDEFIAMAEEFPEQHAQLLALREELHAPPGYGANLGRKRPEMTTPVASSTDS